MCTYKYIATAFFLFIYIHVSICKGMGPRGLSSNFA